MTRDFKEGLSAGYDRHYR